MTKSKTYEQQRGEKTLDELEAEMKELLELFPALRTDEEYEQKRRQIISEIDAVMKNCNDKSKEFCLSHKKFWSESSVSKVKDVYNSLRFLKILPLREEIQRKKGKGGWLPRIIHEIGHEIGLD